MDEAFQPDRDGLFRALELLLESTSDAGVRPGDLPDDLPEIGAGERFGLIRFGSRVDVYLPDGAIPRVAIGQTSIAGETVIASFGGLPQTPHNRID